MIVYLMGDFNINLLNVDKHIPSSQFLETMYSYGYCPIINKPTRIQGYAATLIDHIYTNYYNSNENELFNGIMFTDRTICQFLLKKEESSET